MALQDGYLFHVVAALGLESQIPTNFVQGEIGFITDRLEMIVGDGSPIPARIVTDKTVGAYSLATLSQLTLPSGLVVNQNLPGSIGSITPARMTAGLGILAYRGGDSIGQDLWSNLGMTSSDQTLLIGNPNGTLGNAIDFRINPDSQILINLIKSLMGSLFSGQRGILVDPTNLYIESTLGLGLRNLATFLDPNNDRVDVFTGGGVNEITPANLVASMLLPGSGISVSRDPTTNKVVISNTNQGSSNSGGGTTTVVSAGTTISIQVFYASNTYTPTPGKNFAIAIGTGGGGGGGGNNNDGSSAGGSGGETSIAAFGLSGVSNINVAVGGGGAGGSSTSIIGGVGGDTVLGNILYAHGGGSQVAGGGTYKGCAASPGGSGGIGSLCIPGGTGTPPVYPNGYEVIVGGNGGGTFWGTGGAGSNVRPFGGSNAGENARAYGSGGGGASANVGYYAVGGNGAPGIVMIIEFS